MATYLLSIHLPCRWHATMGALGPVELPAGRLLYVGTALRVWERRVGRHLRREKPLRWHLDWLLIPIRNRMR